MEFTTYIRKPFKVEAVKITKENIEEIAQEIGRIRYKRENGEPFIRINPKLNIPNVQYVYLDFYMTRMGENIRVYNPKVFENQFTENNENTEKWISFLNGPSDDENVDDELDSNTEIVVDASASS